MEAMAALLAPTSATESISDQDWQQVRCDTLNARTINGHGYDCKLCGNKKVVWRVQDGEVVAVACKCKAARDSLYRMQRSGLEGVIRSCTLEAFNTEAPWQQQMLSTAKAFLEDTQGHWFYIGGQVGCGKSHLCTAIVRELLLRGMEARYFPWRDGVAQLKGLMNTQEYRDTMDNLKSVKVLYIDDLFKGGGSEGPTQADLNIAFELLNHRYINRGLVTILSSERTVEALMAIDQAVGSRIYERSKRYCISIGKDPDKNYRTR